MDKSNGIAVHRFIETRRQFTIQTVVGPLLVCVVYGVTILAYWPALKGGFLWDDDHHVTQAALQSWEGLRRIWFELGATQQYYPILHSAFWVEHRLWGDAVLGYHLVNVFLHATNACLLLALLRRLEINGAWLAAFIFALHPVNVAPRFSVNDLKGRLITLQERRRLDCGFEVSDERISDWRAGAGGAELAVG